MTAEAYGMIISTEIPDKSLLIIIFPVLAISFNTLSEFYVDLHKLVHVLMEMQYLLIDKYALTCLGEYNDKQNYLADMKFKFNESVMPGSYFLEKMNATLPIWPCLLSLSCLFIGYHILAFIILKCRAKK